MQRDIKNKKEPLQLWRRLLIPTFLLHGCRGRRHAGQVGQAIITHSCCRNQPWPQLHIFIFIRGFRKGKCVYVCMLKRWQSADIWKSNWSFIACMAADEWHTRVFLVAYAQPAGRTVNSIRTQTLIDIKKKVSSNVWTHFERKFAACKQETGSSCG